MNASIAGEGVARLKNLHSGNSILMDKQNLFTFLCIRFLIIVLLSGFCIEYCSAQQPEKVLEDLQQKFVSYQQQSPQEKLFVHTDKDFYLAGETVWFRIYKVSADHHKPNSISKVAYVEIIGVDGRPLVQAKIDLRRDNGSGSFILPASLNTGNYLLKCYTNWMKNFDENFFYSKPITLVNTNKRPDWRSLEKKEAHSIRFFPEGGQLVEGIESRVAFKITNEYGLGIEGSGWVLNNNNDTMAAFQTHKFGMGTFFIKPRKNETYSVRVQLKNGKQITSGLPQVTTQGYVMQLNEADPYTLQLIVETNIITQKNLYLFVHTRGVLKLALLKPLNKGRTEWLINKSTLGDGVSSFVVVNEQRQPVCERLFFKKPAQVAGLSLLPDSKEYGKRSKINIELDAQGNNAFIKTDLSLSVFLLDSLQTNKINTIESYLWLGSDLTGFIEDEGYYFEEQNNTEQKTATDNLMLVHGWRRFRFEDINKQPAFKFLPEYEGLLLEANIISKQENVPASGISTFVSSPGTNFQTAQAISSQEGRALFLLKNVFGKNELVVQADTNSNVYRTEIQNPFYQNHNSPDSPRFVLKEEWREQLNARHLSNQVQLSFNAGGFPSYYLPHEIDTTIFFKADKTYLLDDYTRFPTMEEVMREFVTEVKVRKEGDEFSFQVLNIPYKQFFNEAPLIMLDGVPVFHVNKIIALDPLKVKKIEIAACKYFWGRKVYPGIVSYTTYDGDLGGFQLDPAALIISYEGLQMNREFYQPVYYTNSERSNRLPDMRNVLYWSPSIETDGKGKKTVSFYSSDIAGTYAVVVQGLGEDGTPLSKIISISIKQ